MRVLVVSKSLCGYVLFIIIIYIYIMRVLVVSKSLCGYVLFIIIIIYIYIYICILCRHLWCNGYCHRKWT